jgi:hypothetical protein
MSMDQTQTSIWLGKAFCAVGQDRMEFRDGYRGAVFVFCCLANDISDCVELIFKESNENKLWITGFEYLFEREYLDREISEYEKQLISRLDAYPVQFEHIHFFLPDS